jgi:hypothetical protein
VGASSADNECAQCYASRVPLLACDDPDASPKTATPVKKKYVECRLLRAVFKLALHVC